MLPLRGAASPLASTRNRTAPFPLPAEPLSIVIHQAPETDCQLHVALALTAITRISPEKPTVVALWLKPSAHEEAVLTKFAVTPAERSSPPRSAPLFPLRLRPTNRT